MPEQQQQQQIFSNLLDVSDSFEGILLDAYGVFWGGNRIGLMPGSKETMERLVSQGKVVGILSNSTQLAAKESDKLRAHGLVQGKHLHFLVTSGEIARQVFQKDTLPFKTARKKFWLFGEIHPKFSSHAAIFHGTSFNETNHLHEADFIYISIPHLAGEDQVNPDVFREKVAQLTQTGLPMVCANPDRFAHEGDPARAVVRQGSIALMYEELGGEVFYIGKPSSLAFEAAMDRFYQHRKVQPQEIIMVGDTPETDIRGARRFEMKSALVTTTGIMADRICREGLSVALQQLLYEDRPDFFIERMARHGI